MIRIILGILLICFAVGLGFLFLKAAYGEKW